MAFDYEEYYRENRHGLGEPTKEFVEFFDAFDREGVKVLDVGCGQGRDALFIARKGHSVVAIDQSPSGIRDLQKDADAEGLRITTQVVDIREFKSRSRFDIILIDRTLHMLSTDDRVSVLGNLLKLSKPGGHVLIADERSNLPAFKLVIEASSWKWATMLNRRGFLFIHRD